MSDLSHLRVESAPSALPYTRPPGPPISGEFALPPRDRVPHAQRLRAELTAAQAAVATVRDTSPVTADELDGVPLTVKSDPGYALPIESLERLRQGVELLSVRRDAAGVTTANLFVRSDKIVNLLRIFDRYETEVDRRSGEFKNKRLVESVAAIRLAAVEDLWQDDPELLPPPNRATWWEVWARRGADEDAASAFARLLAIAQGMNAAVSTRFVHFPERIVTLVNATATQLGGSIDFLAATAELRGAKELPTAYLELAARDQGDFVQEAVSRLQAPPATAPAVCLLDTGVNRNHPMIAPALAAQDWQAVDPAWQSSDHDHDQHGTAMAGVALYRCLTDVFTSDGPISLRHRLESVKLLPPPPLFNAPEVYGAVTMEAVARAEVAAPDRNRAICMAVTTSDDRDHGLPSSWSASVDQICAGVLDNDPKLMFISTGNYAAVLTDEGYQYPTWNCDRAGIEDPSQAWNAVTVGGYTELVTVTDPTFAGWNPIASAGELSPTSRTSTSWSPDHQKGWPIKPDIVMEAGNYISDGTNRDSCTDLSLLSTIVHPTGRLLTHMRDTSAATAAAARLAAIVWGHYPNLWPETVRGLLVHAAEWTPAMVAQFPGNSKAVVQQRLRCFGYGVPNVSRAIYSAENAATLIYEGTLQPFEKVGNTKTKDMHIHDLPWPVQVLQYLGNTPVTMRVTLSYFIEPSPGRKGWGKKFRFASHGLRFDVKSPLETTEAFAQRISKAMWDEDEGKPDNVAETRNWIVGARQRTHGSLHCDWWRGTASELAASGCIAVYPVTGWWKERPHLGKYNSGARYSLIVGLETPDQTVDLYHAIENLATVSTEILV